MRRSDRAPLDFLFATFSALGRSTLRFRLFPVMTMFFLRHVSSIAVGRTQNHAAKRRIADALSREKELQLWKPG